MPSPDSPNGEILLIHDGELADVHELLDRLGVAFREGTSLTIPVGAYLGAQLVISTPPYLLERLQDADAGEAERIVVMEGNSRTLRSMLARGSVEWIVCRPVHPIALRQLVVHCIYRGPEKRKTRRVSVGAEVQIQAGWRRKRAILAEISELDCRILCSEAHKRGSSLKLRVPADIAGSLVSLQGHVIRASPSGDPRHPVELCLRFDRVPAKDAAVLRKLVGSHASGPAVLSGVEARHTAAAPTRAPRERESRSLIAVGQTTVTAEERVAPPPERGEERVEARVEERRDDARYAFDRRVIAISQEATRVLVGRDISRRGMRVDATPGLSVGSKLKIAIHVSEHETPLVLDVHVARQDGADGVMLHFGALSKIAAEHLDDVIAELGGLSAGGDADSASGESPRMVTEILESEAS